MPENWQNPINLQITYLKKLFRTFYLLTLLNGSTGKKENSCPTIDSDGVRSTGMVEVSSDHWVDGTAQVLQTHLVQLPAPVQAEEGVAVHVLHHEDVSQNAS